MSVPISAPSPAGPVGPASGLAGIGAADLGLSALLGAPDPTGNAIGQGGAGLSAALNSTSGTSATGGGAVGGANASPGASAGQASGVPPGVNSGAAAGCMTCDQLNNFPGCPPQMPDPNSLHGRKKESPGGRPRFCLWCYINGIWTLIGSSS